METILYINGSTDSGPYRMKLAGLKRYACMRKWYVKVAYCARGGFSVRDLLARIFYLLENTDTSFDALASKPCARPSAAAPGFPRANGAAAEGY